MCDLHTQSTSLVRLSETLLKIHPGARSEALWHCLGFVLASELEQFEIIGSIHVHLAACWEEIFPERIPPDERRELLLAASSDELGLFAAIDDANTASEVCLSLGRLFCHLRRARQGPTDFQLPLFDVPAEAPPPAVEPDSTTLPGVVCDLSELVRLGHKYPTVYADPPWPYENEATRGAAVRHYPTMSLDAICSEPVGELAEKNAHLHLWTTNGFLHEALQVMDAWGFEFKSCLVWIKPNFGLGNYWRLAHEFLLLGAKGNLRFRDRRQQSWVLAHRTIHSRKPAIVRLLVEKVSPGPYLELFGREEIPNSRWTVYGNDVKRRLL